MLVGLKIRLIGRVQGVFFRAWTRDQARELDVSGWVRNCSDGSVEAHVEGEQSAVDQIVARMREGPPAAQVRNVRLRNVQPCHFDDFEVRH